MHLRNEYDEPKTIDVSILLTLLAVLICMLILVFQSFQEPTPLEYTVQIQDSRDPNGGHTEADIADLRAMVPPPDTYFGQ